MKNKKYEMIFPFLKKIVTFSELLDSTIHVIT